jgi:hypothetical protein
MYIESTDMTQRFYEGVFPTWEWRPEENAESNDKGHQVAHVMFGIKSGMFQARIVSMQLLTSAGQGGGIVKQSKEYKTQNQPNGSGMTVYYLVEDLTTVYILIMRRLRALY